MFIQPRIHQVHVLSVIAYIIITLVLAPLSKSHPRAAAFSPPSAPQQQRQPASDTAHSKLTDERLSVIESQDVATGFPSATAIYRTRQLHQLKPVSEPHSSSHSLRTAP
jgi:hypothetical protein